jgi:hypothetical protein
MMVAEIASASREQSAGISEVNSAIAKIDEMTGKNAVLVEQDAAGQAESTGRTPDRRPGEAKTTANTPFHPRRPAQAALSR